MNCKNNQCIGENFIAIFYSLFFFSLLSILHSNTYAYNIDYINPMTETNNSCMKASQFTAFSGLSIGERFQKLYDGTIEKEVLKISKNKQNDLEVKGMAMRGRNSASGCFEVMTFDTKGLSIQERMIKLYDGSIERSVLKISE
jgi:hypothetical protein|tara:strand:+ start:230 stop:658 length:429 start_codon:yes stop_codon:yes gene_type:complete